MSRTKRLKRMTSSTKRKCNKLSKQLNSVIEDNEKLKKTQKDLIAHNDYIIVNIERDRNYIEYLKEYIEKNI